MEEPKVNKEIDTLWVDTPVCPACGYKDESWWENPHLTHDGDHVECSCNRCDVDYTTTLSISTAFRSEIIQKIER